MVMNNIQIWNTYAEAFPMKCSRLIITAENYKWAFNAVNSFTGFATSVIACGCEAGIEKKLKKNGTPDGRPGKGGWLCMHPLWVAGILLLGPNWPH